MPLFKNREKSKSGSFSGLGSPEMLALLDKRRATPQPRASAPASAVSGVAGGLMNKGQQPFKPQTVHKSFSQAGAELQSAIDTKRASDNRGLAQRYLSNGDEEAMDELYFRSKPGAIGNSTPKQYANSILNRNK